MNGDDPLARLAAAHGIEAGFHDIWGNWHGLSEDTARQLLATMGVAAADDAEVEAALAAHRATVWARLLPPVCVRCVDEGPWLALTLNDAEAAEPLHWRLRLEDGSEQAGSCDPAALEIIEQTELAGIAHSRRRLQLDCDPPPGYHTLRTTLGDRAEQTTLIITPRRCWPPPEQDAEHGRPWGVALQLYGLRSARNWGIGDLGDLGEAIALLGELGADLVGINPLHALYPDEPQRASPYSPSSRRFANPLYLHVEAIPEYAAAGAVQARMRSGDFQAALQRVREAELVDYPAVAALKWPVLRELYQNFRAYQLDRDTARAADFRRFQVQGGAALRRHATFEVLHAEYGSGAWPEALQDADAPAVAEFARVHSIEIEFHEYLQWLLEAQIAAVAERARAAGMRIGLYRDLAVGSDAFGADVWSGKAAYAKAISIGAPPDDFSLQGQVWGLPPWLPEHLKETAYADFISALRANMRGSGALRIDHVIGLMRQFWVPAGGTAEHGAFVHCPIDDLLRIVALESVREECVIIGEDLGTVPDALRGALFEAGVLSYRVLYFEKHWHGDHSFLAPQQLPEQALVTVGTHDLPTLAAWWRGTDLELREALDLFPDEDTRGRLQQERELDRERLLAALAAQDLEPGAITDADSGLPSHDFISAVHRYAARAPSALMMVQMEDVLRQLEQINVPGTVNEQPNWRRRLDLPLEAWRDHAPLRALAAALVLERRC